MFKKDIEYLGFNDFWFTIIGIIVLGFLIPQLFFGLRINTPGFYFPLEWLEASMYAMTFWAVNRTLFIWFRKKYPSFEMARKRILLVIITASILIPITSFLITPIIHGFFQVLQLGNVDQPTPMEGFGAAGSSTFFIFAIYESIWYYSQLKKSIQEQERMNVAHVQSQLDGLRNQVNPHFLFNSLNTLNYIIDNEDKKVAKNFINQLSLVYRYILDSREESTISLEQELEFVKAYVAIQKERFLDSLTVEFQISQQYIHKKIIPLSLQLLIENAIKHNIISTKKPLEIIIDIDERRKRIQVTNNLQKKSHVLNSTKVGLENIRDRYQLLSKENKLEIEETESIFRVKLPLLD